MNNDRRQIVERYTGRPTPPAGGGGEPPGDDDSYQAASLVSTNGLPELMLELRFKTGDALALNYALIIWAAHDGSQGITLQFASHRVVISGRNLRGVFDALRRHRIAYLHELPSPVDDQPDEATVISSIQISAL